MRIRCRVCGADNQVPDDATEYECCNEACGSTFKLTRDTRVIPERRETAPVDPLAGS